MKLKFARRRTETRFIQTAPREAEGRVPFTEEQLSVMRGGLTAGGVSVEADPRVRRARMRK